MVRLCFNSRSLIQSRCCFDHAVNARSPWRRNPRAARGGRSKPAHRFSSKRGPTPAEDPEQRPSACETSSHLSVCLTCVCVCVCGGCGRRRRGRKTTQCLGLARFGQPVFKLAALGGYPADAHTEPQTKEKHTHTRLILQAWKTINKICDSQSGAGM